MGLTLFPIDSAESYIRGFIGKLERVGNTLRWPSEDGVTELVVQHVDYPTVDGLIVSEVVTLRHESPALADIDVALASHLNTWATLSATIPRHDELPAQLVAKVGIFSQDHLAAERLYAPLICMEAAIVGWHAARLARGQFRGDPALCPLVVTDKAPPYESADYEAAKSLGDGRGYLGTLEDKHYTVEVPWDPGAVSNMFSLAPLADALRKEGATDDHIARVSGRTGLLQIGQVDHPLYGPGVQSRLELPLAVDGDRGHRLVTRLNVWELGAPDLPPQFGSWCIGHRAPTFVSFFPTQLCVPGLLSNLFIWNMARFFRVREWLIECAEVKN